MFSESFLRAGRLLYTARFISYVGSAFTEFAVPLYLLKKSGSPLYVGLQWTLIALMRILGGYWAPRIRYFQSDRQALVVLDLTLAVAALLPALGGPDAVFWTCSLATVCVAFLGTLQGGFMDSLVGEAAALEPRREAARAWLLSKNENGRHLGMLVGYSLAYWVSSRVGFRWAFAMDAASFVVSAALLSTLAISERARRPIVQASYSILLRPEMQILTFTQMLVGFALFIYNALHVSVLKQDLHATDAEMSCLYILQYVAYFFGSRLPSRWVEKRGRPLPDSSTVLFRLCVVVIYLVFAQASEPWVFIAGNTAFSFIIGASFPGSVSLFQRMVEPSELRAAGAARLALTSLSGALGAALSSVLILHLPAQWIFSAGALIYLVAGLMLGYFVKFRLGTRRID